MLKRVVVVVALLTFGLIGVLAAQPSPPPKAGESYQVPAGAVHDARSGEKGAKVIATYVVDKGKPLASPAQ